MYCIIHFILYSHTQSAHKHSFILYYLTYNLDFHNHWTTFDYHFSRPALTSVWHSSWVFTTRVILSTAGVRHGTVFLSLVWLRFGGFFFRIIDVLQTYITFHYFNLKYSQRSWHDSPNVHYIIKKINYNLYNVVNTIKVKNMSALIYCGY